MKIFDKFIELFGLYIIVIAVTIAFLEFAWQSVKPIVEKEELRIIKEHKKLEKLEGIENGMELHN